MLNLAILISGNGGNLQAIHDAIIKDNLAAKIQVVISDNPEAYGIVRDKEAGLSHEILPGKDFSGRQAFDAALSEVLKKYQPHLIVLAGFMRILGTKVVQQYKQRMINIHP